jgi:hypothetical protein
MILDKDGRPFLTEAEREELFRKQEAEELLRLDERRWEALVAYCFDLNCLCR